MTVVGRIREEVRALDPKPKSMSTAHVAMLAAKTGSSMAYVRCVIQGEGIRTGVSDIRHTGAVTRRPAKIERYKPPKV